MLVRLMYASRAGEHGRRRSAGGDPEALEGAQPDASASPACSASAPTRTSSCRCSKAAATRSARSTTAIAQDPRHHDVALLSYEEIGERSFVGWSMGQVNMSRLNPALLLKYSESARRSTRTRCRARRRWRCSTSWSRRRRSASRSRARSGPSSRGGSRRARPAAWPAARATPCRPRRAWATAAAAPWRSFAPAIGLVQSALLAVGFGRAAARAAADRLALADFGAGGVRQHRRAELHRVAVAGEPVSTPAGNAARSATASGGRRGGGLVRSARGGSTGHEQRRATATARRERKATVEFTNAPGSRIEECAPHAPEHVAGGRLGGPPAIGFVAPIARSSWRRSWRPPCAPPPPCVPAPSWPARRRPRAWRRVRRLGAAAGLAAAAALRSRGLAAPRPSSPPACRSGAARTRTRPCPPSRPRPGAP